VSNAGIPDLAKDPLPDPRASRRIGVGQQHHELFAAISRREIRGSLGFRGQNMRNGTQAVVAGRVSILVVECLEMIEVDHQERQAGALAIGASPFLEQALVEAAAIGEAGEPVNSRQRLELSFQRLLLRGIARDGDDAVDLAAVSRDAQRGFDPYLGFFPMPGAVGDARLLSLAALQGSDYLLDARQIQRVDARQCGRSDQLIRPPTMRMEDGEA